MEKLYKEKLLLFLYKGNFFTNIFLNLFSKCLFFSRIYGFLQRRKSSKKKIEPFIKRFQIDKGEFLNEDFESFYDFFIRKLRKDARPVVKEEKIASLPADGRYLVFEDISKEDGFYVKGQKFDLKDFLKNEKWAKKYENASMVICRLAPSDYHRFHFIDDCFAHDSYLIKGYLYSVHPVAVKKNISIFCENKRMATLLETKHFKNVLCIEVGACNVGSIHQTYTFGENKKGGEKGYFGLGGSSIVLFFEKGVIRFDGDLLENSKNRIETKAYMGESLGRSLL